MKVVKVVVVGRTVVFPRAGVPNKSGAAACLRNKPLAKCSLGLVGLSNVFIRTVDMDASRYQPRQPKKTKAGTKWKTLSRDTIGCRIHRKEFLCSPVMGQ